MLDTNVFLSALLSPHGIPAKCVAIASEKHTLLLCNYVIEELRKVTQRKLPYLIGALDEFLAQLPYELAETPPENVNVHHMRDSKDSPILAAAIYADVDIIVSGDHHFLELNMEKPKILSPKDFLETIN